MWTDWKDGLETETPQSGTTYNLVIQPCINTGRPIGIKSYIFFIAFFPSKQLVGFFYASNFSKHGFPNLFHITCQDLILLTSNPLDSIVKSIFIYQ